MNHELPEEPLGDDPFGMPSPDDALPVEPADVGDGASELGMQSPEPTPTDDFLGLDHELRGAPPAPELAAPDVAGTPFDAGAQMPPAVM